MEISNREPNILKYLSDALRAAQEFGNKAEIPYLGGAGDLFIGDAQNTAEKLSYGEKPWQGSGQTLQLDPGTADLAGLASIPAGLAKSGARGVRNAVRNVGANKRAAHQMVTSTDAGVKPTAADLSKALNQTDVLSRGMIESGEREAYRQASPRPYRSQPVPRTAPPVQPDMGRRNFLKNLGIGAAGAGAAVAAPKMLATALKAAPKAGATVAKGVAPAVAKGVGKAFASHADIASRISLNMIDAFTNGLSYSKFANWDDAAKYLKKNQGIVDDVEVQLKKEYPNYNIDDFEEGFVQRHSGYISENAKDSTGLKTLEQRGGRNPPSEVQAKIDKAQEIFYDLEPDEVAHWEVTGKWPKGKEKDLQWVDIDEIQVWNAHGDTGLTSLEGPLGKLENTFFDPEVLDL